MLDVLTAQALNVVIFITEESNGILQWHQSSQYEIGKQSFSSIQIVACLHHGVIVFNLESSENSP